jgi:ribosome biogenesis GTPase
LPEDIALEEIGYSPRWQALIEPYAAEGLEPARIARISRGSALAVTAGGIVRAQPSSRLVKAAAGPADLPAVGGWVALGTPEAVDVAQIEAILPRASAITRGDPGKSSEKQVLAANVDTVFVVHPIADEPNLRRIERELSLAWDSGAVPVVVLTKEDLSADADEARAQVESVALGVDVLVTSALTPDGAEPLLPYLRGHRTAVLVGPSGAGKSTLLNALLGVARQETAAVRVSDGRGRHTTVARELFRMPGGGVLIDTPGLRALGLTGSEEGISSAFPEIQDLAEECRFRDCSHTDEPGCAVQSAVAAGSLAPERLASYHKLVGEAQNFAVRMDSRLRAEAKAKDKVIPKAAREYFKRFGKR